MDYRKFDSIKISTNETMGTFTPVKSISTFDSREDDCSTKYKSNTYGNFKQKLKDIKLNHCCTTCSSLMISP